MSPRLQLGLERDRYSPGETVRGKILVLEGGPSRSVEARLEFNEETSSYREVPISISSGRLHEGDLTAGTSFEFELALPPDALPNHTSENGELYWHIDATSNEFGRDTHERSRIAVGPAGGVRAAEGVAPAAPSHRPTERAPTSYRWVWRVFFAVGGVFVIAGAVTLVRTVQFVVEAERTTGTVVRLSRETDSEGDETFYPVVRFTTADGKEVEFVSSTGSSPPSESPGDEVDVLYDPDDPSDAELSGFVYLWLFPIIFLVIGAAAIVAAWFVRLKLRPRAAAPR